MSEIDGPAIGDRAPDVDFESGGTLFDRLRHPYLTLLVMPDGTSLGPVESLTRRFNAVLATEMLPRSAALSKRYGPSDGRLFLVRPDGYVAFKGPLDEAGLLETYLARMMRM